MNQFYVQIEITEKCNLRCKHCYIDQYSKDMTFDEFKEVIKKILILCDKLQMELNVAITGGEPLYHIGLIDILTLLCNHPLVNEVVIFTNGTLIDESIASILNSVGITSLQVSIDGTKEVHNSIRGSNSYENLKKGLELLTIPVSAHFTLSKMNQYCFQEMVEDCINMGIKYLLVSKFVSMGSGVQFIENTISPEEWFQFYIKNKNLNELYANKITISFDRLYECLRDYNIESVGCGLGTHSLSILNNGDILLCRRLPIIVGNLFNDDLLDIWENDDLINLIRSKEQLEGYCGSCNIKEYCGGCRATAYTGVGSLFAADPYCLVEGMKL